MPSNRKNNHYHYAEKFDDRRRRRPRFFMPKRTALVAALFLLIFGIVSTTFSAYVASANTADGGNSIIVNVRTAKAQKDIALTGATADIASTGANFIIKSGTHIYVDFSQYTGSVALKTRTYVYLVFGNDANNGSGARCYRLNQSVTNNTDLRYVVPNADVTATYLAIFSPDSDWGGTYNSPGTPGTWSNMNQYKGNNGFLSLGYSDISSDFSFNAVNTTIVAVASDGSVGSVTYEGNSNSYTDMNKTQNMRIAVKAGGGSAYTTLDSSATSFPGTFTMTGIKAFTGWTTVATSNPQYVTANASTPAPSASVGYGSSVTLNRVVNTGFKFDQYSITDGNSNTTTQTTNSFTPKGSNTITAQFTEYMHNVRIYNNVNSSHTDSNASVGAYTTFTATAPTISGYTFTNWSAVQSGVMKPTGYAFSSTDLQSSSLTFKYVSDQPTAQNVDLTANYVLNPPVSASLTGISTYHVGDDGAVTLSPTVNNGNKSSGATEHRVYTVTYADGTAVSSGASVDANGNFTATVPGTYKITLTVYNTEGSFTSDSVTSSEVTVTAYPEQLTWTLTMTGHDPNGYKNIDEFGPYGGQTNPYLVTLGSNFSFTLALDSTPSESGYSFRWFNGENELKGTGSPLTPVDAAAASEATLSDVHVSYYCEVHYFDSHNNNNDLCTTLDTKELWYYIKSPIRSFTVPDLQKIYSGQQGALMNIEYNITGGTGYTTTLYESDDAVNYYSVTSVTDTLLGTHVSGDLYTYDVSSEMYVFGPKYFYLNMSKTGGTAKTEVIHTTVGTAHSAAKRPIYFINDGTGLDLTNYRVMAFYLDGSGNVKYQTGQDVFKGMGGSGNSAENVRFRVNIPSDATKISFAIAKKNRYKIPDYPDSGNSFTYSDNTYFLAFTETLTLDNTFNTVRATGKTLVSGYTETGDNPNPFYSLSGFTEGYNTTGAAS